jgi:hypothetical protein
LEECEAQGRSLVFLDESGFAHDMPRTHGYSAKGSRCFGVQDWGAKGRTNVIGALLSGVLLTIPLFQTNVNTAVFDAWVIHDLVPKFPKNSVVIMDNASFHKGQDMVNALEDGGHALLYMPPDLNPISIPSRKNGLPPKPKDARLVDQLKRCFMTLIYNQIIMVMLYINVGFPHCMTKNHITGSSLSKRTRAC